MPKIVIEGQLLIAELEQLPFLSGYFYVKWKLHHGAFSKSRGQTTKISVENHCVIFNEQFCIKLYLQLLEDSCTIQNTRYTLDLSIRQEWPSTGGGSSLKVEKIGSLSIDLLPHLIESSVALNTAHTNSLAPTPFKSSFLSASAISNHSNDSIHSLLKRSPVKLDPTDASHLGRGKWVGKKFLLEKSKVNCTLRLAFCFSFARKNICLKLKAAEPAKGTNPRHFLSPSVLTTTAASANTASDYSPLKSDDNSIVSGDEALAFDDEALSTLSSDRELQSDLLSITSSLHHEQQDTDAWVKKITDPFFSSLPEAEYQANIKFIQKLTRKYEATSKNYL